MISARASPWSTGCGSLEPQCLSASFKMNKYIYLFVPSHCQLTWARTRFLSLLQPQFLEQGLEHRAHPVNV